MGGVLTTELSYNPAIPLLGIYPREMKTYAQLFTAVLFIIAKSETTKYPSTDSRITKCAIAML